ncbi:HAMP domain-containing protein [Acetobacter musti]|uniref:histidine kinase n=1 Tax=Acetobacter musti TaxID=864732 RepID=A0ABX0JTF7_9PROT|nr:ATP-binding protein [Acetobacter musti]NHN85235.1 HAMP domain-containing protein [Acetobacter musti]
MLSFLRGERFELFRTTRFHLAVGFAMAILLATFLQFSLIYSQMTTLEFRRSGQLLHREMDFLVSLPPDHLDYVIRERSTDDLRIVINEAGIFTPNREPVTGDLKEWPEGLVADGELHASMMIPEEGAPYKVWFLAGRLPDGRFLALGRSIHPLGEQKLMLRRASLTTIVPILFLALVTGVWLSHRALARVKEMHEAVDRIMQGDIHERLPAGPERDDLQRLAGSVNRMLDRLEQLMHDMRDVGNDIAHDLRTPLARVRAGLERVLSGPNAGSPDALRTAIGSAIENLDQCFSVITALLRMAEIDNGRRRDGFATVDLEDLARDIIDLYEPIAESEDVSLYGSDPVPAPGVARERAEAPVSGVSAPGVSVPGRSVTVQGDRDLLIEMLANLVDNAIKFTPSGGSVKVDVGFWQDHPAIAVTDTGIGIAPQEREVVLTRFWRSDKSRHIRGSGLGLSLVASILRLHNARVLIEDARPGDPSGGARLVAVFPVAGQGREPVRS